MVHCVYIHLYELYDMGRSSGRFWNFIMRRNFTFFSEQSTFIWLQAHTSITVIVSYFCTLLHSSTGE